jgi:glycerophosphoryl diester phosphodiesterase
VFTDLDRPLNIAHRGASTIAPQNTLTAFEEALQAGADGIEFDVRLSADGTPVVIHDAKVDTTTDGSGQVSDLTLAELKKLDAGASFDPGYTGERIPTLEEVLETFGESLLLNIELKGMDVFDRGLERAVIRLVKKHRLEHGVLLSSFNPVALRRVQKYAPRIATALLYAYSPPPLLHVGRLLIPRPNAALHPHHTVLDEAHLDWARGQRIRVHVWTVDDPDDMRRFVRWGIDGIITNTPRVLQEVLADIV